MVFLVFFFVAFAAVPLRGRRFVVGDAFFTRIGLPRDPRPTALPERDVPRALIFST